jgi:drug/metabolite transporter (DMT)-like permease
MRKPSIMLAFAIVYTVWGSTYLAIGIAVETVPPLAAAGSRFLLAGAVLYLAGRSTSDERPTVQHWRTAAVLGSLLPACGNGLIFIAQQSVASSLSAVFVATEPIFVALIGARWLGLRIRRRGWLGIAFGTCGIVMLAAPWEAAGNSDLRGLGLLCLGSFAWSVGSVYSRSAPAPRSPLLGSGMTLLIGGALLLLAAGARGELSALQLADVTQRSWIALGYLVVFGSIVAYTAYLYLLRHVSASTVSTYAYVNPLVGLALGVAIAGERLDPRSWLAAGAIVLGAILLLRGMATPPPLAESEENAA